MNATVPADPRTYAGRRVVVTGASGFVGRWIARKLAGLGAETYLIVRDRNSTADVFDRYSARGETIEADLAYPGAFEVICRAIRPAIVFNCAAYGVDPSQRDEDAAKRLNTELPAEIASAVSQYHDATFPGQSLIHTGSALEYGNCGGDLRETSPAAGTTVYGRSKLDGTVAVGRIFCETGLRGLTVRLFSLYGPGEHSGRLVPSLMRAARSGEPIALTAGLQRRDFTYVEDAAEGLLRLGLATIAVPKQSSDTIVNLATGRLTSVRAFTEAASEILCIPQTHLLFGIIPTRPEEMEHSETNVDRLRCLTNWTPSVSIPEGIRKTVDFLELQPC